VSADDDVRVSTIELFFDLVFVFTITQLTSLLVDERSAFPKILDEARRRQPVPRS
jgi:low temperature requirement protein LtrA